MKRAILATALVLGGVLSASADHSSVTYRDLIRPNGHKRSDAVFNADVSACQQITHNGRYDSPAMKRCLLKRGYQWEATKLVEDRPTRSSPRSTVDWTDFLQWQDSSPPPPSISDNPACPGSLC